MAGSKDENRPPKLLVSADGSINQPSLADLLEWFLNHDQRVALVRHPHVEELFQWKARLDEREGIASYPFENAEARFAVGVFQALEENATETKLQQWITEMLEALGTAKQRNEDLAKTYKLKQDSSHIEQSEKLSTDAERNVYLTSCWIESLCTAEVRFLGWVFQELYGKPFQPTAPS